jgi:acetyl-CoA hydrolase
MAVSVPQVDAAEIDFAALLEPGDLVAVGQGSAEPLALTRAFSAQAGSLPEGVGAFVGLSYSGAFGVEFAERVPISSYGALADLAAVAAAGLLAVVPCQYSELPWLMREGPRPADVVLVQVSTPDADGLHSLGTSIDHAGEAIEGARLVIAEVNERMPAPPSAVKVPADSLDIVVETARDLITMDVAEPTDRDRAMAANVLSLVPEGAAIQLGFGGTATAIGRGLGGAGRPLRVHSALVGDWLLEIAEAGLLRPGADGAPPVVTGAALGSAELYAFLAANPVVFYDGIEALQKPAALARVPKLVAINSGLQVDLAGNVNAELIGERRVGARGGHTDFLAGAQASDGGAAIVVLPAATVKGASRIVSRLDPGAVTTGGGFVDFVVTEHGVADLRGRTIGERAAAIAAIADPAARDELVWTER